MASALPRRNITSVGQSSWPIRHAPAFIKITFQPQAGSFLDAGTDTTVM
jgi:hypothetical protein